VGHKFGAPKGIAALYIRVSTDSPHPMLPHLSPMLVGGGQERGTRGGTENVAYIAGFGEACRLYGEECGALLVHLLACKHRLLSNLLREFKHQVRRVCT
jgi:cysteine desulfurase